MFKVFYLHRWMIFVQQGQICFRSNEELKTFKYLTFNISQTGRGIFTHSTEYIEKIEVAEIDKPGQKDIKLLPH